MNVEAIKLADLAKKHGIKHVVLYGSHALGNAKSDSDIDVAVYLEPDRLENFYFNGYLDLLPDFAKATGVKVEKIDLVLLNTANILLRYEITSKGELLFGDPDQFTQYQAFAFRDYLDAKSLFELESYLISKRQALIA